MKRFVFGALLLCASMLFAQNPFDGTWKISPNDLQFSAKPYDYQVKDGRYICSTCVPKIDVKADGTPQPFTGSPYADTISVKLLGDSSIQSSTYKGGKLVGESTFNVSSDGNTLTITSKDMTAANGQTQTGTGIYQRVGKPPATGNKISGRWKAEKVENVSSDQLTFTFSGQGNELTYKAGTGESYTAKLDGKDYPYKGDPGTTSVSLKQINDRTIEETDKRDGKAIYVTRMTISADGKTMTADGEDKLRGRSQKWTATKQ